MNTGMSRARRGLIIGAATLTLGVVATTLTSAGAATTAKYTPVPIATPEGQVSSYVVNAKKATSQGTADALDGTQTRVRCWVNGALRQDGPTQNMIFDIPTLI